MKIRVENADQLSRFGIQIKKKRVYDDVFAGLQCDDLCATESTLLEMPLPLDVPTGVTFDLFSNAARRANLFGEEGDGDDDSIEGPLSFSPISSSDFSPFSELSVSTNTIIDESSQHSLPETESKMIVSETTMTPPPTIPELVAQQMVIQQELYDAEEPKRRKRALDERRRQDNKTYASAPKYTVMIVNDEFDKQLSALKKAFNVEEPLVKGESNNVAVFRFSRFVPEKQAANARYRKRYGQGAPGFRRYATRLSVLEKSVSTRALRQIAQ